MQNFINRIGWWHARNDRSFVPIFLRNSNQLYFCNPKSYFGSLEVASKMASRSKLSNIGPRTCQVCFVDVHFRWWLRSISFLPLSCEDIFLNPHCGDFCPYTYVENPSFRGGLDFYTQTKSKHQIRKDTNKKSVLPLKV